MDGMDSTDGRRLEMKWLADHEAALEKEHPGEWVAVQGYELVGIGPTLADAARQAEEKGFTDPLFAGLRAKEYQGLMMFRRWR